MTTTFLQLLSTKDLGYEIFKHLPPSVKLSVVCQKFKEIVDSSRYWQYHCSIEFKGHTYKLKTEEWREAYKHFFLCFYKGKFNSTQLASRASGYQALHGNCLIVCSDKIVVKKIDAKDAIELPASDHTFTASHLEQNTLFLGTLNSLVYAYNLETKAPILSSQPGAIMTIQKDARGPIYSTIDSKGIIHDQTPFPDLIWATANVATFVLHDQHIFALLRGKKELLQFQQHSRMSFLTPFFQNTCGRFGALKVWNGILFGYSVLTGEITGLDLTTSLICFRATVPPHPDEAHYCLTQNLAFIDAFLFCGTPANTIHAFNTVSQKPAGTLKDYQLLGAIDGDLIVAEKGETLTTISRLSSRYVPSQNSTF